MEPQFRIERDSMGEVRVPSGALYGPQTQRAVDNFPISGLRFPRSFIRALGLIKAAAAKVNGEAAIEAAANQVMEGVHDSQFVLDIFQTGSGTSTNMNAPPGFARAVIEEIARRSGLPFVEAGNHFEAQAARDAVTFLSGALRTYAIALTKIANDIRWLGSGPRCGLGELKLPEVQPGSSIMPGKVNPVIAESVLMVCAQVIGYDSTIAWCGAAGHFELNVMMPLMAYDLLASEELLAAATRNFSSKLVDGLEADRLRA